MKRIICWLRGHVPVRVREVGVAARPGGILPAIDGYVVYEPAPDGDRYACARCRTVPLSGYVEEVQD